MRLRAQTSTAEWVGDADDCPQRKKHTPGPTDARQWFPWATRKVLTHKQSKCPVCGLWVIWTPKGEKP